MNLRSLALTLTGLTISSAAAAQSTGELATRYPIVLSHHWSGTADISFRGEWNDNLKAFEPYGVKKALEAGGAIVYQPDKLPLGDHIVRGKLLYKKCAVTHREWFETLTNAQQQETVEEALCQRGSGVAIDGVEKYMADYCSKAEMRAKGQYSSEADCIQNFKINIICHSQGCPDSRYMISGMTNKLSGKPMADHVASWTSLAGANKGTLLADAALGITACTSGCNDSLIGELFALFGYWGAQKTDGTAAYNPYALDSLRSLTRKYMTQTMDMGCNPNTQNCAPSFNQAFPNSPKVYYQTYSLKIDRLDECTKSYDLRWALDWLLEGSNDGLIAVESQRFTTTGYGSSSAKNVATNVVDRGLVQPDWVNPSARSYPGMAHMAPSTHPAAGMSGVACAQETLANYSFSRVNLYKKIVKELKARGF